MPSADLNFYESGLSAGARQREHPTMHAAFRVLNVFVREPFFAIHPFDRINTTHEIVLVTERNRSIDAHAAFEIGVRRGPFALAGRHAFGGHEGLAAAARQRIDNIALWIYPW